MTESRVWIDTKIFRPSHRSANWCATLNNAREMDFATLRESGVGWNVNRKVKLTWVAAGIEHGPLRDDSWITPEDYNSEENQEARSKSGVQTPHLQMAFQTSKETTWQEVLKIQSLFQTAQKVHVEPCQGGLSDQREYCQKEASVDNGSYFEIGEPVEFKAARRGHQGKRSDLEDIQKEIHAGTPIETLREKYFGSFASHEGFLQRYAGSWKADQWQTQLKTNYENVKWRPWQQQIVDLASGPPLKRKLTVIVDPAGAGGKSYLADYLSLHMGFLLLNPVSKRDMAYILCQALSSGKDVPGVVIDVPRSVVGTGASETGYGLNSSLASLYCFGEGCLDGRITSTKYESVTRWFKPPHVFLFTNHPVEICSDYSLSKDRWNVFDLKGTILVSKHVWD